MVLGRFVVVLGTESLFGRSGDGVILGLELGDEGVKEVNNILGGSGFKVGNIFPNILVLNKSLIFCPVLNRATSLKLDRIGILEVCNSPVEVDFKVHFLLFFIVLIELVFAEGRAGSD